MLLIAPTEPPDLRAIGTTSSAPEKYGVDILFATPTGFAGVQRKEVRDLVASIRDDRISRELGQSEELTQAVLLVEGNWMWQANGTSLRVDGFLRSQFEGLMLAFQHSGWWVMHSDSLYGTIDMLPRIANWFAKEHHHSLRQRPNHRGIWGTHTNRDWAIHLLQSFDGIGVELAGRIYDQLGVPLRWTATESDLLKVPGVGKKKAQAILAALDGGGMMVGERGEHDE